MKLYRPDIPGGTIFIQSTVQNKKAEFSRIQQTGDPRISGKIGGKVFMKKIMFCFAAVLAAFIFAGCSKKPSFTTEEGAAYIRDVFSRKGEDILDTMKGGIGTCRQTPSIISITEEGKTDSHFDKRWYKVTYVAKHASLKQGQRFCVCSEKRETGHVFVNRVKGTYSLGVFQLGGITDVFK